MTPSEPRHILIVKASSLGDILHALPVGAAIKARFPRVRLTWIVEQKAVGVLEGNRHIDELLVSDFTRWKRAPLNRRNAAEFARFARRLRALRPDVAIDLQGLTKSGLITYFSGARVRIGLDAAHRRERWTVVFSNRLVRPDPGEAHVVDQLFRALGPLGIAPSGSMEFPLWIGEGDRAAADDFYRRTFGARELPRVALAPGGGWVTKRWDPENYAALGDRLYEATGSPVVILWGPGEEGLVAEVRRRMRRESVAIPPADVKGLLALIAPLDLVVGGDTGPVHMAAALGVPTVGVYGPSDPARNGPYGAGHRTVRAEEVPCLGCYRRTCEVRWCMTAIDVETVCRAALDALSGLPDSTIPGRAIPAAAVEDDPRD